MNTDKDKFKAVFREAMANAIGQVHTSIPAKVVSYDHLTQMAEVKPCIRTLRKDPEAELLVFEDPPIIAEVPVLFHASMGGFGVTFPLEEGDFVLLHVSERSLVEWKAAKNEDIEPADVGKFNLTHAFAVPGGRPGTAPVGATGAASGAMVVEAPDLRLGSATALHPFLLSNTFFADLALVLTELTAAVGSGATTTTQLAAMSAQIASGAYVSMKVKGE